MKSANPYSIHPKHLENANARRRAKAASPDTAPANATGSPSEASRFRTNPRDFVNPVDYQHPYDSMGRFAKELALRYDANRTRHSYYRQLRLIHEHFHIDPALISEAQLRDYFLFVKLKKHWRPKSIRQALAAARLFFVDIVGRADWTVFGQIRTRDHDVLPAVLTRQQVQDLIAHIRLRRYRTPIKLIYVCGLRLSECLALTIHDIKGPENKLLIRNSKGHQDRVVPLPTSLYEELRRYWAFHRHPLLIFPNVGRGDNNPEALAQRMRQATAPMPCSSLQRLLIVARKELRFPDASIHSLRHSFATHLLEAGAHLHTIQKLLGHKQITSTMVYLHLTHQSTRDALELMEQLCRNLPR
jgi:site-specific recombinase XerD